WARTNRVRRAACHSQAVLPIGLPMTLFPRPAQLTVQRRARYRAPGFALTVLLIALSLTACDRKPAPPAQPPSPPVGAPAPASQTAAPLPASAASVAALPSFRPLVDHVGPAVVNVVTTRSVRRQP